MVFLIVLIREQSLRKDLWTRDVCPDVRFLYFFKDKLFLYFQETPLFDIKPWEQKILRIQNTSFHVNPCNAEFYY